MTHGDSVALDHGGRCNSFFLLLGSRPRLYSKLAASENADQVLWTAQHDCATLVSAGEWRLLPAARTQSAADVSWLKTGPTGGEDSKTEPPARVLKRAGTWRREGDQYLVCLQRLNETCVFFLRKHQGEEIRKSLC